MKKILCNSLLKLSSDKEFVFLTGDLGFDAFEKLQDSISKRFINAGIAEQNMIGVAAGLAKQGMSPWCYSIAPFIYARAFEQIRNNICAHNLPVKLVGNGGGYGYGVMGATHHSLEDYGILSTLPNIKIFIPAFENDLDKVTKKMSSLSSPSYLRMGICEWTHLEDSSPPPDYHAWRELLEGELEDPLVIFCGPLVGTFYNKIMKSDLNLNVWLVSELPIKLNTIPENLIGVLRRTQRLILVEEHVQEGGMGEQFCSEIIRRGDCCLPLKTTFLNACGYPNHRYGSQLFHRNESGLTFEHLTRLLKSE